MDKKIIPTVEYASKRDLVVRTLREMILSGQIVPGQRLRQEELSQMLGVSATPIREAIRLLEADGLLHGETHRGVSVVELSANDLQDICRMRSMLEAVATRQAVDRSDPQAYTSCLERLEVLQREMEKAIASGKTENVAVLNREFHLKLYDLSRSPYLIDMIRRLWMHLPGYVVWENRAMAASSVEQHRPILEALRARHGEAAARAMQAHIELSAHALLTHIREHEAAGLRLCPTEGASAGPGGRIKLPKTNRA